MPHATVQRRVELIAGLMLLRDPRAADEIDALADELRAAAARIREESGADIRATGGAGTRVQMNVVGPEGEIKQSVDTGVVS